MARINGHTVNLALLKELGEVLVDIHGQSEHLSLLNVHAHLGLLDRYAGIESLLAAYRKTYQHLLGIRRELEDLIAARDEAENAAPKCSPSRPRRSRRPGSSPVRAKNCARSATGWPMPKSLANLAQQALTVLDEGTPESPAAPT